MDTINAAAMRNADIAIATSDSLCSNVVTALESVLYNASNSGTRRVSLNDQIYRTIKNTLFLKYIGLELEYFASDNNRDDALRNALRKSIKK